MSEDSTRIKKELISKGIAEGTKKTTKEFYQYQIQNKIRYFYNYKRNGRFVKIPTIELRKEKEIRRLNQELRRTNLQFEKEPSNKILNRIELLRQRINIIDKRDMYERYLWEKSQKEIIKELLEKRKIEELEKREEESAIERLIELITGEKAKPKHWWTYIEDTSDTEEYDWYVLMTIYNEKTKIIYDRLAIVTLHRTKNEFLSEKIDSDYIEHYLLREYEILEGFYFVGKPVKYIQEKKVII